MTRRIDLLPDPRERAAVEALFRSQGWPQTQIDALGDEVEDDEVFNDQLRNVRAVLAALDTLPPQPRKAGQLNATDAQALRLDLGADAIALMAWMPGAATVDIAIAATGNRTSAWRKSADQAAGLTAILTAAFAPAAPSSPAPTSETAE